MSNIDVRRLRYLYNCVLLRHGILLRGQRQPLFDLHHLERLGYSRDNPPPDTA